MYVCVCVCVCVDGDVDLLKHGYHVQNVFMYVRTYVRMYVCYTEREREAHIDYMHV